MAGALPLRINPLHLAEQRASVDGTLPLKGMHRLRSSLLSQQGDAQVALRFRRDAGGVSMVEGELRARVDLQCQRCLQPVAKSMARKFSLAIVCSAQEAARLQAEHEVLELEGDTISTSDLVEDEILLSLPLAPLHEDVAACDAVMVARLGSRPDTLKTASRTAPNPFAVLKELRKR